MTIAQIYTDYKLMPNLQTHMLRVAGVGLLICDHFDTSLDRQTIVTACLLHDMGNIIKFDLKVFPEFVEPEGLAYWEQVQAEYVQRYGADEHQASMAIARELGVNQRVLELIDAVSFSKTQANLESGEYDKMICEYADDRVTPWGVVSLEERIEDLEIRYGQKYPSPQDRQRRQRFAEYARQIEAKLFSHCQLKPTEITDQAVEKVFAELGQWEV